MARLVTIKDVATALNVEESEVQQFIEENQIEAETIDYEGNDLFRQEEIKLESQKEKVSLLDEINELDCVKGITISSMSKEMKVPRSQIYKTIQENQIQAIFVDEKNSKYYSEESYLFISQKLNMSAQVDKTEGNSSNDCSSRDTANFRIGEGDMLNPERQMYQEKIKFLERENKLLRRQLEQNNQLTSNVTKLLNQEQCLHLNTQAKAKIDIDTFVPTFYVPEEVKEEIERKEALEKEETKEEITKSASSNSKKKWWEERGFKITD